MAHDFKKGDTFVVDDTNSIKSRRFVSSVSAYGITQPYTVRKVAQSGSLFIEGIRGVWLPIEFAKYAGGPW